MGKFGCNFCPLLGCEHRFMYHSQKENKKHTNLMDLPILNERSDHGCGCCCRYLHCELPGSSSRKKSPRTSQIALTTHLTNSNKTLTGHSIILMGSWQGPSIGLLWSQYNRVYTANKWIFFNAPLTNICYSNWESCSSSIQLMLNFVVWLGSLQKQSLS